MHSSAGLSPHRRNLMQGVGGGLREQFAGVLRAPVPEALATLMRRLETDTQGKVCDYGISPPETASGTDSRGRLGTARAQRGTARGGRSRDN